MKRLTRLDLRQTRITDAGLANLSELPRLTSLVVAATRIGDAGVARLGQIRTLEASTRVPTPRSAMSRSPLSPGLPACASLQVGQTSISPQGNARIREALPACQVSEIPTE